MSSMKRLGVVAPTLERGGVGLALLDRILAGYPEDGRWIGRAASEISLWSPNANSNPDDLARRRSDLGLMTTANIEGAAIGADGVVMVPAPGQVAPAPEDLARALGCMPRGSACFVAGLIGETEAEALQAQALARKHGVRLGAAGLLSVTFRLPEARRRGDRIREALIVVQGDDATAKVDGVLGLKPEWHSSPFPEAGTARRYENDAVWRAAANGEWSWDLLAAALSRSSNPQGNSVTDGRTQDLVGLGVVQQLAQRPRAWVTDHAGGVRSVILSLDGVVGDVNLATRDRSGDLYSTRLYRPPAPNEAGYHRLAGVAVAFLEGQPMPWREDLEVGLAAWWEALK
ncbi:MAG: hypothetical protein AB7O66_14400 [Limisphaerales bacterium]